MGKKYQTDLFVTADRRSSLTAPSGIDMHKEGRNVVTLWDRRVLPRENLQTQLQAQTEFNNSCAITVLDVTNY